MAELSTIARPYAEALFAAVRDDSQGLESWSALLSEMAQVAGLHDVREALNDPRLNNGQRLELFTGLVKSQVTEKARNFLQLLVDNQRILLLPQIAEQFDLDRKSVV